MVMLSGVRGGCVALTHCSKGSHDMETKDVVVDLDGSCILRDVVGATRLPLVPCLKGHWQRSCPAAPRLSAGLMSMTSPRLSMVINEQNW